MHWAKVSALPLCCAQHDVTNPQDDVIARMCLPARVCTAGAWLRANTWRQNRTAPTSAPWQLSCVAHPWALAATRPTDRLALGSDTAADNAANAFSMLFAFIALLAFHLTGLAVFLHCIIWRQLTLR